MQPLLPGPAFTVVLGLLCGVVGFRIGWRARRAAVLPAIQGLFGFVAFASSWRTDGAFGGALAVGAWALGSTLAALLVFMYRPDAVDERVLRARGYREEMLAWLRTGRGPETTPLVTARAHLLELALYLAAAMLTGNLLAIVMGAVLLNYMNAYVARLLMAARRIGTVGLLAWNCWSVVRVAAYIMLGSACATFWGSWLGYPAASEAIRWLVIAGSAGVVLDLVLKLTLSRPWGRRLGSAVDLERAASPAAMSNPRDEPCPD